MNRRLLKGTILSLLLAAILFAGRAVQAAAKSTDTAVAFVRAVQAGNIEKAKGFLDDAKRRPVPRGGDDAYFQPASGQTPNLGFLVGADVAIGNPSADQVLKDSFCFTPLDCGEGQYVHIPLTLQSVPNPKRLILSMYLTHEGLFHPWRIHHFSIEPSEPPKSLISD